MLHSVIHVMEAKPMKKNRIHPSKSIKYHIIVSLCWVLCFREEMDISVCVLCDLIPMSCKDKSSFAVKYLSRALSSWIYCGRRDHGGDARLLKYCLLCVHICVFMELLVYWFVTVKIQKHKGGNWKDHISVTTCHCPLSTTSKVYINPTHFSQNSFVNEILFLFTCCPYSINVTESTWKYVTT